MSKKNSNGTKSSKATKALKATKPAKANAPATKAMTKATTKGKAPKARQGMSLLDATVVVLKGNGQPMRCKDIVAAVKDKGLWTTDAPTPEATLYSAILRELGKGKNSRFVKKERGLFALNG